MRFLLSLHALGVISANSSHQSPKSIRVSSVKPKMTPAWNDIHPRFAHFVDFVHTARIGANCKELAEHIDGTSFFAGCLSIRWLREYARFRSVDDALCSVWHYSPPMLPIDDILKPAKSSESLVSRTSEQLEVELQIRLALRELMQSIDLDDVTTRDVRRRLAEDSRMALLDLSEHRQFIDREMLVILGQLDKPSRITDYLFLGTEWNASNWEELRKNKVKYILNVTKEVDNFFPDKFKYMKIWVTDEASTELLMHWQKTYEFIKEAKECRKRVLVHCKKGISRSASTVIAYCMKEYGWNLEHALDYVKERRNCITPNEGFMEQLATFDGVLKASNNRHSAVFNAPKESDTVSLISSSSRASMLSTGRGSNGGSGRLSNRSSFVQQKPQKLSLAIPAAVDQQQRQAVGESQEVVSDSSSSAIPTDGIKPPTVSKDKPSSSSSVKGRKLFPLVVGSNLTPAAVVVPSSSSPSSLTKNEKQQQRTSVGVGSGGAKGVARTFLLQMTGGGGHHSSAMTTSHSGGKRKNSSTGAGNVASAASSALPFLIRGAGPTQCATRSKAQQSKAPSSIFYTSSTTDQSQLPSNVVLMSSPFRRKSSLAADDAAGRVRQCRDRFEQQRVGGCAIRHRPGVGGSVGGGFRSARPATTSFVQSIARRLGQLAAYGGGGGGAGHSNSKNVTGVKKDGSTVAGGAHHFLLLNTAAAGGNSNSVGQQQMSPSPRDDRNRRRVQTLVDVFEKVQQPTQQQQATLLQGDSTSTSASSATTTSSSSSASLRVGAAVATGAYVQQQKQILCKN